PSVVWLTESPAPRRERVLGETRVEPADPEFLKFFTRRSREGGGLVHRPYREVRTVYRVGRKEIGAIEESELIPRLDAPKEAQLHVEELPTDADDKFAFIYRA